MALRSSTKEKILDVAEGLFAEYGFNDTSLRTITSKAGVNLGRSTTILVTKKP